MFDQLKLTIGRKLGIGYGILILVILFNVILTIFTTSKNVKLNKVISEVYAPSGDNLNKLSNLIVNSKMLIKNWVFIEKKPDTPDKKRLVELQDKEFPAIKSELDKLSLKDEWSKDDKEIYNRVIKAISDSLFVMQKDIMAKLNDFSVYDDPNVLFNINPQVEQGGTVMQLSDNIISDLNILLKNQNKNTAEAQDKMNKSFSTFKRLVSILG